MSLRVLLLFALSTPATTAAQLIAVRTVPIADADQFSFFPSLLSGMGGVRIAVADSLHDAFVNPAAGARLRHSFFFSAPTVFSVSSDAGSGHTYPLGVLGRSGSSFGGAALAIQSITEAQPLGASVASAFPESQSSGGAGSRTNRYGFLMLGRTFVASSLSVGASALASDLGTIDGTSLSYADSRSVSQAGRLTDVRLGLLKEWNAGHSFEALLVNRRVRMTHDVTYGDLYWDPLARRTVLRDRLEYQQDRTNVWGMHLEYAQPIGDSGWRAGVIATANQISSPSRPANDIEAIPGNRGRSTAFNLGVGVARSLGATTLAADVIYEPIWSRIWGVSDTVAGTGNTVVLPGEKTVESRMRFSNAILRGGISHDVSVDKDTKLQFQLGVHARSIYYTLDQRDLVHNSQRDGDQEWMEWTRSWGATVRHGAIEFNYRGRQTTGAGRPGILPQFPAPPSPGLTTGSFRAQPAPTTTLRDVSVMTHQLSLSLRIR